MQPYLHDLVTCVHGTVCVLGGTDGQIGPGGAQGLHWLDTRSLTELTVTVEGRTPAAIGWRLRDDGGAEFVAAAVGVVDDIADPTVVVERRRTLTSTGMVEEIAITNLSRRDLRLHVDVAASCDFAALPDVKDGAAPPPPARPSLTAQGAAWASEHQTLTLTAASADGGGPVIGVDGPRATVAWRPLLPSRSSATLSLTVDLADERSPRWFGIVGSPPWRDVEITSASPALDATASRARDDLANLLLADGTDPFAAAGAPWFLTLFGRDALWTARFLLPLTSELAGGTLRVLARRQATEVDEVRSAEPGKILHELRLETSTFGASAGAALTIPDAYYGTVDATALWISLLHDAWQWGLPPADVRALLEPLELALGWIAGHLDRFGFLSYHDVTGTGLANQGWKDSGDSIQDAQGRIARTPVTLCEVQAYAFRALGDGSALLAAHGRPGASDALRRAADLAVRFRERFWVERAGLRFPAIALDRNGEPVDSLTSNIGHLLGTGLLEPGEEELVATAIATAGLTEGYGLRTLDAGHPQFNPLGYHSGSVWPHDTAITVGGLCRAGHGAVAARLTASLLEAAPHFGGRLPELFAGRSRADGPPLAYPAACRPQAWSAAAVFALVTAATGLSSDPVDGSLVARPDPAFAALFPLTVRGLRVGSRRFVLHVDAAGEASLGPG